MPQPVAGTYEKPWHNQLVAHRREIAGQEASMLVRPSETRDVEDYVHLIAALNKLIVPPKSRSGRDYHYCNKSNCKSKDQEPSLFHGMCGLVQRRG